MSDPLLIVVTGMPASGKTTLANAISTELQLPLIAKDEIKERLYDAFGVEDSAQSRRLGHAAHGLIFAFLHSLLVVGRSAVAEANFFRGVEEARFRALPPHRLVQIHCFAPLAVLVERYVNRSDRHSGHFDQERVAELAARFKSRAHAPLDLEGELIDVDTSRPVRLRTLLDRVA